MNIMWLAHRIKILHTLTYSISTSTSTIFAVSSGKGKCGVAVIRISGPNASEAILKMTKTSSLPPPRLAMLKKLYDPETLEELDRGLILWFPGPKSFTGEDSCEFQIHGGNAVIASVLSGLSKLHTFRPAEAGDFTRRAFHAGKLDLTEVEGLGDLIHADTEMQRKQALLQMDGNLSELYMSWRQTILKNVAHVEAYIDFSEDENIEDDVIETANQSLRTLRKEIQNHLTDGRRGERLRDGVKTVILGEPNVGKSSILNVLCQRPAAIVTPIAGTTRDVIELQINISDYPLILADTAGLRTKTTDYVEQEGIARAHEYAKLADLIILVVDAVKFSRWHNDNKDKTLKIFIEMYLQELNLNNILHVISNSDKLIKMNKNCIIVINKHDLIKPCDQNFTNDLTHEYDNVKTLSCKTDYGFEQFIKGLTQELKTLCANPTRESPTLTQARHRYHLTDCEKCLEKYFTFSEAGNDVVLAAQQLRTALRHIGKITGHVSTEQILDVIFKDFCIGK